MQTPASQQDSPIPVTVLHVHVNIFTAICVQDKGTCMYMHYMK